MITKKSSLYVLLGSSAAYAIGAFILSNKNSLASVSPGYAAPVLESNFSPLWFLGLAALLLVIIIIIDRKNE